MVKASDLFGGGGGGLAYASGNAYPFYHIHDTSNSSSAFNYNDSYLFPFIPRADLRVAKVLMMKGSSADLDNYTNHASVSLVDSAGNVVLWKNLSEGLEYGSGWNNFYIDCSSDNITLLAGETYYFVYSCRTTDSLFTNHIYEMSADHYLKYAGQFVDSGIHTNEPTYSTMGLRANTTIDDGDTTVDLGLFQYASYAPYFKLEAS